MALSGLKIFPVILFIIFFPTYSIAASGKVIEIVDGDTVVIEFNTGPEKLRFLRVSTPESVHPDKNQNVPMGTVAAKYTEKRLLEKYVEVEHEGPLRGRYHRLLGYVFVDGTNFSLELIRQGLSPYYTKYGFSKKYHDAFITAEKLARKEKLGIWGDPELAKKYLRLKSKWGKKRVKLEKTPKTAIKPSHYIGNKKSKKFHHPKCWCIKKMKKAHKIVLESRKEAIRLDYEPCGHCGP